MKTKTLLGWAALAGACALSLSVRAEDPIQDFDAFRSAVAAASDGDTITLGEGTYYVTSVVEIKKSITIVGAGKGKTIFDGGSTNETPLSVTALEAKVDDVSISGITFANFKSPSSNGAVHLSRHDSIERICTGFVISDCAFTDCQGSHCGGVSTSTLANSDAGQQGVVNERASYPIVSGCDFVNCVARGGSDNQGAATSGTFWIENSTFDSCSNENWGIVLQYGCTVVTNCTFSNMSKGSGNYMGLIAVRTKASQNDPTLIRECRFVGIGDGALAAMGNPILDRCIVSNCYALAAEKYANGDNGVSGASYLGQKPTRIFYGSGNQDAQIRNSLFIDNKFPVTIVEHNKFYNCTFVDNVGGLFSYQTETDSAALVNCVIWNNAAWSDSTYSRGVPGFYFHNSLNPQVKIQNSVIQNLSSSNTTKNIVNYLETGSTSENGNSVNFSLRAATDLESGIELFVDAENGNYVSATNSVLNKNGVVLTWMSTEGEIGSLDLAGHARYYDGGVDIGCYQGEFAALESATLTIPKVEGLTTPTVAYVDGNGVTNAVSVATDEDGNWIANVPLGYETVVTFNPVVGKVVVPGLKTITVTNVAGETLDVSDLTVEDASGTPVMISAFDPIVVEGADMFAIKVENASADKTYYYRTDTDLLKLKDAALTPIVEKPTAGVLLFNVPRNAGESQRFYEVLEK